MEKILNRKVIFKGRKIWIWEKEIDFGNGLRGAHKARGSRAPRGAKTTGVWEVAVSYPDRGACILAIDGGPGAIHGAAEYVYLIKQFKGGPESRMLTLPTGGVEKNETPLQCAKKELREEAGLCARKWKFLFKTRSNPGYTDATGYIFLARGLTYDPVPTPEQEDTIVIKMPFKKALAMVMAGRIEDQRTALAILWYAHFRK